MNPSVSLLAFFSLLMAAPPVTAEIRMPAVFASHMVLQAAKNIPVWGTADPGEKVTLNLGGVNAGTTANQKGQWKMVVDLSQCGPGPFELIISGKNTVSISDVAVGQVWMVGGQSNMELPLKMTANGVQEAANAANPRIRVFRVPHTMSDQPAADCKGQWTVAGPAVAGDYSAIGYYFAKGLEAQLRGPVGIIDTSWNGTNIELWCSQAVLDREPVFKEGEERQRKLMAEYPPLKEEYVRGFARWLEANGREDKACPNPSAYAGDAVDLADWKPVTLPGPVITGDLPRNGAIWLRKELDVTENQLLIPIKPAFGQLTGFATVYWNGEKVSDIGYRQYPGAGYSLYFQIPPRNLRVGKNIIAVRFYAPGLPAAFNQSPENFIAGPLKLAGQWLAKAEYSLPAASDRILKDMPAPPNKAPEFRSGAIFNGVVNPVIPFGISGILWYQGESNTSRAYQYRTLFPLFIEDLRNKWDEPLLPFYFCQLANNLPKKDKPGSSEWAELREAQAMALRLPATGQAVLIDLGESDNVHYLDKASVADRLVRIALTKHYGRKGAYSGPTYRAATVSGNEIAITFDHADEGLVAHRLPPTYDVTKVSGLTAPLIPNSPGSQLEGFAICGADQQWVWANARIEGDRVVVSSPRVPQPIAVRYGWADNPTCNLYNGAGLPASPFRTDSFPVATQNNRFGLARLSGLEGKFGNNLRF